MKLLSKIQGSLLGVIIGDALGMPWEIFSAEKIAELTEGVGVVDFASPVFRKLAETEHLRIGSTTDDWQLTQAIAQSLIRRQGFDLLDQALAHVKAYETSTSGWGGTTRRGLEQLRDYFNSRGASGRHPDEWATGTGCGNGIGMKISPIPCFLSVKLRQGRGKIEWPSETIAYTSSDLREYIVALGKLTHPDFRATVAGYAVASMLLDVLMFDLFGEAKSPAENLFPTQEARWLLNRTLELCRRLEATVKTTETDLFSTRLQVLLDEKLLFGPVETLRATVGTSSLALESVCFAIAIFLRHPKNFREGLLEAVNSGGDTDTIAAMAGSLIGAVVGREGIPEAWKFFTPQFAAVPELGAELYQAAEG